MFRLRNTKIIFNYAILSEDLVMGMSAYQPRGPGAAHGSFVNVYDVKSAEKHYKLV